MPFVRERVHAVFGAGGGPGRHSLSHLRRYALAMSNAAIDAARRFHELTTHTPTSVRMSGHTLDWDVKPFPFKVYTEAPSVALPREIDALAAPAMTTLAPHDGPPAGRLTLAA